MAKLPVLGLLFSCAGLEFPNYQTSD